MNGGGFYQEFTQEKPIEIKGRVKIAPSYRLLVKKAEVINGTVSFSIDSEFIPVETYQIENTTDYGTINGQKVGFKNLIKVFDLFENIAMLDQGLTLLDMQNFVIPPGVFVPEPSVSSTIDLNTKHYLLFYLVKI